MHDLIQSKELIRFWFEFYKLALKIGDANTCEELRNTYKGWGDVAKVKFDSWWPKHEHLFTEQKVTVVLDTFPKKMDPEMIYFAVSRNKSVTKLVNEIRGMLAEELHSAEEKLDRVRQSGAKFVLVGNVKAKPSTLRIIYDIYSLSVRNNAYQSSSAFLTVVQDFYRKNRGRRPPKGIGLQKAESGNPHSQSRTLRRFIRQGSNILRNVILGRFPDFGDEKLMSTEKFGRRDTKVR